MKSELKELKRTEFPPSLLEIPEPPRQLFVRGALPSDSHSWIAVVGSRSCTPYGRQCVSHLIGGLSGYPVAIISGLAYGIDAAAHRAALDAGLRTVGVPGSGLDWDVIYPRAHVSLAREIVESGGALLSEFAPTQKAAEYTFPQRNRIMVGLCKAVLVIEAKERSGSLITARLTGEYNRELLVVPGSIFSAESRGTHQFLKLGATPVTEPEDILRALGIEPREAGARIDRRDLTADEVRVLEALTTPLSRDELGAALDMTIAQMNTLLSMMEIKNLIVEEFGSIRRK